MFHQLYSLIGSTKKHDDILTVQGEVKTRWTEHYIELLNITTEGNEEEENQLQGPIAANTNYEITTLEVEAVINCKRPNNNFQHQL